MGFPQLLSSSALETPPPFINYPHNGPEPRQRQSQSENRELREPPENPPRTESILILTLLVTKAKRDYSEVTGNGNGKDKDKAQRQSQSQLKCFSQPATRNFQLPTLSLRREASDSTPNPKRKPSGSLELRRSQVRREAL